MPTTKPRFPRALRNYVPVSDEEYERAIWSRNFGHAEPIWSVRRKVDIFTIRVDKTRMAWPNDVDMLQVDGMIEYFDRAQWQPVCLDHEGYLLDGQHRLEVCRRKGWWNMDAIVRCADFERIMQETKARDEQIERERKDKRQDPFGDWLTHKEWEEHYGTRIGFGQTH